MCDLQWLQRCQRSKRGQRTFNAEPFVSENFSTEQTLLRIVTGQNLQDCGYPHDRGWSEQLTVLQRPGLEWV